VGNPPEAILSQSGVLAGHDRVMRIRVSFDNLVIERFTQSGYGPVLDHFYIADRFPDNCGRLLQAETLQKAQDNHMALVLRQIVLNRLEDRIV
jgi:hypothetical protein